MIAYGRLGIARLGLLPIYFLRCEGQRLAGPYGARHRLCDVTFLAAPTLVAISSDGGIPEFAAKWQPLAKNRDSTFKLNARVFFTAMFALSLPIVSQLRPTR